MYTKTLQKPKIWWMIVMTLLQESMWHHRETVMQLLMPKKIKGVCKRSETVSNNMLFITCHWHTKNVQVIMHTSCFRNIMTFLIIDLKEWLFKEFLYVFLSLNFKYQDGLLQNFFFFFSPKYRLASKLHSKSKHYIGYSQMIMLCQVCRLCLLWLWPGYG